MCHTSPINCLIATLRHRSDPESEISIKVLNSLVMAVITFYRDRMIYMEESVADMNSDFFSFDLDLIMTNQTNKMWRLNDFQ